MWQVCGIFPDRVGAMFLLLMPNTIDLNQEVPKLKRFLHVVVQSVISACTGAL